MDWIATDLDRTLFCRTWNEHSAVPATWRDVDGARQPSSWMPADTHRLLRALQRDFRMVAVTARDLQSFRRVALPGITLDGPSVIANGAIILGPEGSVNRAWSARMACELAPWRGRMGSVAGRLQQRFGDTVRSRMVLDADGQPAYLVAKSAEGHWARPDVVEAVRDIDLEGLVASTIGPELQLLPPCISKRRGLAEVAARWFKGAPPTLALGDARGDLGFMRLARWLAAPRGSELEASWI
jgi:hydroxymethylpyrimidine pyrophosphatase-like HAD family hydrolase